MFIILLAISLSMDAFSLAILYGTLNLTKKDIYLLSFTVGVFHFIMPNIGNLLGKILNINSNILVTIILSIISFQMIFNRKEEEIHVLKLKEKLAFSFAVSLDSFSVGILFNTITNNYILSSLIISFTSFIFTNIGLNIGKKVNEKLGKYSTIIGGVFLFILALTYLFK